MKIILHWIVLSFAVFVVSYLIKGISVAPFYVSFVIGACLTLFSLFIKPIINILTLPINIVTFGLFSLVINGFVLWTLGSIIKGFSVSSYLFAFVGSLLIAIVSWVTMKLFHLD